MSINDNKAIVRGYMKVVLNKGNLAVFDNYFSEAVVFNNLRGAPAVKQLLAKTFRVMNTACPDFHLIVEDQIAEGDKVVTRVTFRGTHQGAFRGVPPTGKPIAYTGIAIDRIAEGKVVEMWHEADTSGMLRQLGVAPKAG
jgi:steroid delta-isomerase-like uncharacterized protein